MTVLVVGATGFLGSEIARRIAEQGLPLRTCTSRGSG